jgi:hypothetical protein
MTDQNDFIKLLFDTLKETTDDNTAALQKLVDQQVHLVSTVEKMPISDLKKMIEDHDKESSDDIAACEETVKTKSDTILEKVNDLSGKVKLMIGVVAVALALTGVVYVVGRYMVEYHIPKQEMATVQKKLEKQQKHDHKELVKAVREEIKKFHPEADKQEEVR